MVFQIKRRLISRCAVCALVLSAACDFSARMEFHNRTQQTMTPYPLNLELEPPRRVADPANALAPADFVVIDPRGFNPVFYAPGITDEAMANGIFLGLGLIEADPLALQYKVFHYRVPPGEAGSDPDLQPILLQDEVVEIEDVDIRIAVRGVGPSPDGWNIRIFPR